MLGLGYAYRGAFDVFRAWMGFTPHVPPIVLDIPGTLLAEIVGGSADPYYSEPRAQLELRQRAEKVLYDAAGLRLANCVDFGGVLAGSIFGGEVIHPEGGPPRLSPVISSPDDVTRLAARVDAMSIEKAGLTPRLFEWRHNLRHLENMRLGYAVRLPGLVTLAEQVCGAENLYTWIESHPGRIMELAGVLRRTLMRLVQFIRRRTGTPTPLLIVEDPSMAKLEVEVFHEIFWRATRSVVFALTAGSLFRCYRAQGSNEDHAKLISRLAPRVVQLGHSVGLEAIRFVMGRKVVWGSISPELLRDGDPDQVGAAAHKSAEAARSLGLPIFLSPAGAVQPGTPIENIVALASAFERK